jgi:hypothetical protein
MLMRVVPFSINYLECYVFIWWSSMESKYKEVLTARILFQVELRSVLLVDQVWIKDIEFVSLHNFWRRVVCIIVCLIVLVPLKPSMYSVEKAWFAWSVLVLP